MLPSAGWKTNEMGDESREIGESNYLTPEFNDFTQEIDISFS